MAMPIYLKIPKSAKNMCILFAYIIFTQLRKDEQRKNVS